MKPVIVIVLSTSIVPTSSIESVPNPCQLKIAQSSKDFAQTQAKKVSLTGIFRKKQQPGTQRGHELAEWSDRIEGATSLSGHSVRFTRFVPGCCLSERQG